MYINTISHILLGFLLSGLHSLYSVYCCCVNVIQTCIHKQLISNITLAKTRTHIQVTHHIIGKCSVMYGSKQARSDHVLLNQCVHTQTLVKQREGHVDFH